VIGLTLRREFELVGRQAIVAVYRVMEAITHSDPTRVARPDPIAVRCSNGRLMSGPANPAGVA
jgi:hypothetical protein